MDRIQIPDILIFENFLNTEYWIICFLKMDRIPNTNSTIRSQLFEYRILNTKYGNWPNSCSQKYFFILTDLWQNEIRKFWFFVFVPKLKIFTEFFIHFLLYKDSKTIRYLVITIRVFEYYSEITNRPNTNSTIRSQLFEYRIIRIIRCNSGDTQA